MNKLAKTLKYVFGILVFPYSFGMWLFQFFRFRKCIKILKNTINSNNDFYQYLEKLDSRVDWLGRVYTVQPIPKEFQDFTNDELYDITMRSLLPMTKMLEKNVLIDVCSIIISRIDEESYIVCLTTYNFPKFQFWVIMSIFSLLLDIIILIIIF